MKDDTKVIKNRTIKLNNVKVHIKSVFMGNITIDTAFKNIIESKLAKSAN